MANTISSTGRASINVNGLPVQADFTLATLTLTGSNITATSQNINTGSWQSMDTSSLSDVKFAYFQNPTTGSTVKVAADSSGTNVITTLTGDEDSWAWIPWSGTYSFYARAYSGSAVLNTIFVER